MVDREGAAEGYSSVWLELGKLRFKWALKPGVVSEKLALFMG